MHIIYKKCTINANVQLVVMPCSVCRSVRVFDQVGRGGQLQVIQDETHGGFFNYSQTERGAGMKHSRTFLIPSFASVRGISIDIVLAAYESHVCGRVEIMLRFNNQMESVYTGSPLAITVQRINDRLIELFMLHALHPRNQRLDIVMNCYTSSQVVRRIQKNANSTEQLDTRDIALSEQAMDLLAQVKCWFRSESGVVLAKHALAAFLLAHLIDDLKIIMKLYPDYWQELRWSFETSLPSLNWEQLIYCNSFSFLCQNPVMILSSQQRAPGHWHRLRFAVLGLHGIITDIQVHPGRLPIEVVLRLEKPQLADDNVYLSPQHSSRGECTALRARYVSFYRSLLTGASCVIGKGQIGRRKYWEKIRKKYAPGSDEYQAAAKRVRARYVLKKSRFWTFLLYLGYRDLQRAKTNRWRKQKLKLLAPDRVRLWK